MSGSHRAALDAVAAVPAAAESGLRLRRSSESQAVGLEIQHTADIRADPACIQAAGSRLPCTALLCGAGLAAVVASMHEPTACPPPAHRLAGLSPQHDTVPLAQVSATRLAANGSGRPLCPPRHLLSSARTASRWQLAPHSVTAAGDNNTHSLPDHHTLQHCVCHRSHLTTVTYIVNAPTPSSYTAPPLLPTHARWMANR